MRRLLAMVLACEAVVIGLAIPVAITVAGTDGQAAGIAGGGLMAAALVLVGLLRYSWAVAAGSVLQILVIATGFVVPVMFFLGIVFGALWAAAFWVGRSVERAQTR